MHNTLLARLKGCVVITAVVVSILIHFVPGITVTIVKVLIPWRISRLACTRIIIGISISWIQVNNFFFFTEPDGKSAAVRIFLSKAGI